VGNVSGCWDRTGKNRPCYAVPMQTILPIAAVVLALFAAGCIAFIAWEVTKEASRDGDPDDD
jgi:hypothetical protein